MRAVIEQYWKESHAAVAAVRAGGAVDRFELVTGPEALFALRDEWRQLCARTPGHYLGQTFEWVWLCWQTVVAPRGRSPACVIARREGRLVLVWPLAVAFKGWLGSIARPLDSESSEYSDILIEDGPDAEQRAMAALGLLRRACPSHRVELANVREASVLGRVLAASPPGLVMCTGSLDAASVNWRGVGSWDEYVAGLDAHERRELGRKKRRLDEGGPVRLEVLGDLGQCAEAIDWALSQKLEWLDKTGRSNEWIAAPEHRTFLRASMAAFGSSGRRLVFVLRRGEEMIAMLLSSVDGVRMEWFMCASHPGYASLSPAQVLRERVLHWAHERRLDCDFRLGDLRFKRLWGNSFERTSTYVLANSAWGRVFLLALPLKRKLAERLPRRARAAVKAMVRKAYALTS